MLHPCRVANDKQPPGGDPAPRPRLAPTTRRLAAATHPGSLSLGTAACLLACHALACNFAEVEAEGEFGRAIALGSGDASPLPRLAYLPEPCPGTAGGCTSVCLGPPSQCPAGACVPVLIDSGTAITMLADDIATPSIERGCFELRSADQVLVAGAAPAALAGALSRFRFDSAPLIRLPRDPAAQDQSWGWAAGPTAAPANLGGIIGGNVLREFAVRFAHRVEPDATRFEIAFYREFPGSEAVLADQGRAAIPLQFPGLLLGKDITDVCLAGGESCDFLTTFDRERVASALRPTRMVLDACVGAPPATVEWDPDRKRCRLAPGPAAPAGQYHSATGAAGERAEEDRGALALHRDLDLFREGRAVAQVAVGAEVELPQIEGEPGLVPVDFEELLRLLGDGRADAITADDRDFLPRSHVAPASSCDGFSDQPSARSIGVYSSLCAAATGP